MQFEGAVIKEQGVTFAIVIVKPNVLDYPSQMMQAEGPPIRENLILCSFLRKFLPPGFHGSGIR